jgi:hypothetical protein
MHATDDFQPRTSRGLYDAQVRSVRSLSCRQMIGAAALHKAERKSFARPGASANCVIARLRPQLSHLAEMGYKASRWRRPIYTPGRVCLRLLHLQNATVGNSVCFCEAIRNQPISLLYQIILVCTSHP